MRIARLVDAIVLAVPFLAALPACDKEEDRETFVAELDGRFEGVNTRASGRAVVVLSRGERADISVTVTSISDIIGAHIHRAPRGLNGPIIFFLWRPAEGPFGPGNPVGKTWTRFNPDPQALTEENVRDLRTGNMYVNIHTESRPSGEIRGQLVLQ